MNPIPPTPYIPTWKNLKIFLLGLVWCCLGGSGTVAYELWDAKHWSEIDWGHIRNATALTVGPVAIGYWRKYRALISPPPEKG